MNDKMMDNFEVEEVMKKLEALEDEELAVKYLREFNELSSKYGQLLMNREPDLDHDEWKKKCDEAQTKVRDLIQIILGL